MYVCVRVCRGVMEQRDRIELFFNLKGVVEPEAISIVILACHRCAGWSRRGGAAGTKNGRRKNVFYFIYSIYFTFLYILSLLLSFFA